MGKRLFYITTLFIVCVAGTFYILKPNPKGEAERALDHLKEHNYRAAETTINELRSQNVQFPLALYRGYLAQAQGQFAESDLFLQMALKEPLKQEREEILVEILLAQAANAYFSGRDHEISPLLVKARSFSSSNPFLLFFDGLADYLHAHYADALKTWGVFSKELEREEKGWMPVIMERLFPVSWQQMHLAHCLAEEGNLLASREILERESHCVQADDQKRHQLATLFLGLTYLKEAQQIPLDQRKSYYQLARFYFERSGSPKSFTRERARIIAHVQAEAKSLLLSDLTEEQRQWGFGLVHTLHEWKAEQAIQNLANDLAKKMLEQDRRDCIPLCQSVRQEFIGSPFHVFLTQHLLSAMAQQLKDGETEDLFGLWALVESLSPTPKLAAKQIATLTSEEIFRTIRRDGPYLDRTRYYIAFWDKLGRSTLERERLSRDLLVHAKLLWQKEGHENKGQNLMEIAMNVSGQHPLIHREVERYLTSLYAQAESTNMIARLTRIYDAMEHFDISRQQLISPGKIANHLADAEYLYHVHNYTSSKTHAEWVLKLDPRNEQAQRLLGLSSFHLGEYGSALIALKPLTNPDEDARKALVLSQAFASQDQEKHLAQIDNTDSFEEDE